MSDATLIPEMAVTAPAATSVSSPRSVIASDRAGWLANRKAFITASDAAKVLGLSKWGGPMDVYLDKTKPLDPDTSAAEHDNKSWLEGGRRFEEALLRWYGELYECDLTLCNQYEIRVSPTHHRIGATLDAMRRVGSRWASVDAKLVDRPRADEWGEPNVFAGMDRYATERTSADVPLSYAVQLLIQNAVLGADAADFAELAVRFPSQQPVGFRIYRDEANEREVLDRCQHFYEEHIVKRVPPPVDGSDSYARYLKSLIAKRTEMVEATPEHHEIALKRTALVAQSKEIEAQLQDCENRLKAAIGDAHGMVGPTWRITWKPDRDSVGADYEGIALALGTAKHVALLKASGEPLWDGEQAEEQMMAEAEKRAAAEIQHLAKSITRVTRKGARKFVVRATESTD